MDLSSLNEPQKQAVTNVTGPMLVLAGAGSGKTRVITHRIARLLESGVPARTICALTFTNKAAAEMQHRVLALVGYNKQHESISAGTFHSLGLQILRKERVTAGLPRDFKFTIRQTVWDACGK